MKKVSSPGEPAIDSRLAANDEAAADHGQEARDREIFKSFEENLRLVAEILMRQIEDMGPPEANQTYYHAQIEEEVEALKLHMKQIQGIIGYLQALKKLYDRRLKRLRGIRDWVRSFGRERRGL